MSDQKKKQLNDAFYVEDENIVLEKLQSTPNGLSTAEAEKRLKEYGHNQLDEGKKKKFI